jgi:pimeloyl-ACP methyl ester carboxylesterase
MALEIENRINIVGHSYGGWLTGQYALKFPEKLNKIVLLAPAGTVLPVSAMFMMRAILCAIPHDYFLKSFSRWTFEDYIKKDKKGAEKEIKPLILASKCFKSNRPAKSTVLNDDELKSIKTPVLFMVGENEKLYPAQKAVERFNTVAPRIQTEIIPNAGHDLCKVQAELVNEMVLKFLK